MPKLLLTIVFFVTIFLLTIANFQYQPLVLGATTETPINTEQVYFEELIKKNPNYFPAYIALFKITGNEEYLNKARVLNPNSVELPQ